MSRAAFIFVLCTCSFFSEINGAIEICPKLGSSKNDRSNEEISTFLKELKQGLEDANSRSNPIESTRFDYFHFSLSHPAITVDADITNGTLTIKKPDLAYFNNVPTGLEIFNLTFPEIYIDGTYNFINGYIGHELIKIYGAGNFYLILANFSIAAVTGLNINKSEICVSSEVNVYASGSTINFENLMNNDPDLCPLLNAAFTSIMPDILRLIFRDEADKVDSVIQKVIDFIMKLVSSGSKTSLSSYFLSIALEFLNLSTYT